MPTLGEMHPELLHAKNAAMADMKGETIMGKTTTATSTTTETPAASMDMGKLEAMLASLQAQINVQDAKLAEKDAQIAALQAAKSTGASTIKLRVYGKGIPTGNNDKDGKPTVGSGTIALTGLGRFPAVHFPEHWLTFFEWEEEILGIMASQPVNVDGGIAVKEGREAEYKARLAKLQARFAKS